MKPRIGPSPPPVPMITFDDQRVVRNRIAGLASATTTFQAAALRASMA
jgi:hypothetical protein